jgi:hypothetical protein
LGSRIILFVWLSLGFLDLGSSIIILHFVRWLSSQTFMAEGLNAIVNLNLGFDVDWRGPVPGQLANSLLMATQCESSQA